MRIIEWVCSWAPVNRNININAGFIYVHNTLWHTLSRAHITFILFVVSADAAAVAAAFVVVTSVILAVSYIDCYFLIKHKCFSVAVLLSPSSPSSSWSTWFSHYICVFNIFAFLLNSLFTAESDSTFPLNI